MPDVAWSFDKFYSSNGLSSWRTASHVSYVEGSGPPYLVFYDRGRGDRACREYQVSAWKSSSFPHSEIKSAQFP